MKRNILRNYVKVEVTQELIAQGVPNERSSCPVALALQDALNRPSVSVWSSHVYLDDLPEGWFALPEAMVNWIERYDDNPKSARPRPITFLVHKRFVRK